MNEKRGGRVGGGKGVLYNSAPVRKEVEKEKRVELFFRKRPKVIEPEGGR